MSPRLFFVLPATTIADFGPVPDGARRIDLDAPAPFDGLRLDRAAIDEVNRCHLLWLRGEGGRRANLTGANLAGAYLSPIRDDLWTVLDAAPAEVDGLLGLLRAGKVDGQVYRGACACLVGSLANLRGREYTDIPGIRPNGGRPAERWFLAIRPGDTPENHPVAAITASWIEEWQAARGPEATPTTSP